MKTGFFTIPFFRKAAALTASFLLTLGCLPINPETLKLLTNDVNIAKIAAVQKDAFNISARINKAAQTVSVVFKLKLSDIKLSFGSGKYGASAQKSSAPSAVPAETALIGGNGNISVVSVSQFHAAAQNSFFGLYRIYIDPGGGGSPGQLFSISYFLIMLLFFASSRKVYESVFTRSYYKMPACSLSRYFFMPYKGI